MELLQVNLLKVIIIKYRFPRNIPDTLFWATLLPILHIRLSLFQLEQFLRKIQLAKLYRHLQNWENRNRLFPEKRIQAALSKHFYITLVLKVTYQFICFLFCLRYFPNGVYLLSKIHHNGMFRGFVEYFTSCVLIEDVLFDATAILVLLELNCNNTPLATLGAKSVLLEDGF